MHKGDEKGNMAVIYIASAAVALGLAGIFIIGALVYDGVDDISREQLFWGLIASGTLIMAGLIVLTVRIIRANGKNAEIREKLRLLELENEQAKELGARTAEIEHRQRLELIGTMTSGIAHEFNNMLTPIMGYSIMSMDLLPDGPEEVLDNLSEIYEASSRAKELIARLRHLSRKRPEERSGYISPDALLRKVEEVSNLSLPKNIDIVKNYNCPEKCVYGDEVGLGQAALNIVINAIQAMSDKGGTLTISTEKKEDRVHIVFEDTGPGIRPEDLPKIFDPFFTTKDSRQGTGLGLAIVQHVVSEHGGTVTAGSEPGKGARFEIILPVSEMPADAE